MRRSQDLVVRVWAVTAACTVLPLALVQDESAPFAPALAWTAGLAVLTLVTGFAAWATANNVRALESARAARQRPSRASLAPESSVKLEASVTALPAASLRTLHGVAWLFSALTAAYGAAATALAAETSSPGLPAWALAALALPWLLVLRLGGAAQSPTTRASFTQPEAVMPNEDQPTEAANLPVARVREGAAATGSESRAASSAGHTSRPAFEMELWETTPRVPVAAVDSRPSSLGEAVESIFPRGAELRPEVRTHASTAAWFPAAQSTAVESTNDQSFAVQAFTQHQPEPSRLDSGVQELKKQPLTEPKRRRHHPDAQRLSQIATEPPPSTAAIDSSERDTERPPSRSTERAAKPQFNESDIPTTPAPPRTREAEHPDGPASGMLAFELKIPKSPRAPTFGRSDRAKASPDAEQSFRPTRRAGPFVDRGNGDALAEALNRPTRPAEGDDVEARLNQMTVKPREGSNTSQSGERAISLEETPKPASFTRDTATQLRPSPSQFDLAYSRFESANQARIGGYVEPSEGEADGVREAAPKSHSFRASTGRVGGERGRREMGGPTGQLDSEIRWVDRGPSTIPALVTLESDLLETLQGAKPRSQGTPRSPRRKTALH